MAREFDFSHNLSLLVIVRRFNIEHCLVSFSRPKDEAEQVIRIIRFFKQGMAPIRSQSNLFIKTPHTFRLKYLHKNAEHRGLNTFKECALQSFGVNYTPTGNYATYGDGTMVQYEISMGFNELEPIFNDQYKDDSKEVSIGF